jgi:biopolymer transport protein ExbB/TolQ
MDDFLKMDIFFAITTFVVVVWGLIGAILLIVVIRVLRHIERLSRTVADGAEDIRGDLDDFRANVREEGVRLKHIYEFFTGATSSHGRRSDVKAEPRAETKARASSHKTSSGRKTKN